MTTRRYIYRGDEPTAFIYLRKDGHTWVPKQGDTIDSPVPIDHPLLELVEEPKEEVEEASSTNDNTSDPAEPEENKKPSKAQESEDN